MKVALGLTFLLITGITLYFYQSTPEAIQSSVQKPSPQNPSSKIDQIGLPEMAQPSIDTPLASNTLWQRSDGATVKPHLRSDITDAALVRYDRTELLKVSNGLIVDAFIPQLNEVLAVQITSSELLPSGNVSIKGHLASDEIFSFVMTIGENSMFATIGTPSGIYNVSGNREVAWVIPALSLKKQINTDILDYRSINPKEPAPLGQNG